jgi:hypothetical protein
MKVSPTVIAALLLLTALESSLADGSSATVKAADYGDAWPFKVSEGVVSCALFGNRLHIVTFTAGGKTYALNGTARNLAKERGYAEVDAIWREDPIGRGIKVNIGPIIDKGLSLCGE